MNVWMWPKKTVFFIFVVTSLGLGSLSAVAGTPKTKLVDIPDEAKAFIGSMEINVPLGIGNPIDFCLEDGALWSGSKWRVGAVHAFGVDPRLAADLPGKTVLVLGEERMSLADKVIKVGPCPKSHMQPVEMQLRSDWLAPEIHSVGQSTHELLRTRPYLQAHSVQPIRIIEFIFVDEKNVRVQIKNPLRRTLKKLSVIWHYEGGPGKPMPHFVEEEISLRPGQSNDSERPRILHEKAGRAKKSWWKLHKVTVKYKGQNLTIDASEFVPRIKSSERRKTPGG